MFDQTAQLDLLVQKLQMKRNKVIAIMENGAFDIMEEKGININYYETVYVLASIEGCFAFNKSVPDSLIKKFQKALDKLKRNGTLTRIMAKNGVRYP